MRKFWNLCFRYPVLPAPFIRMENRSQKLLKKYSQGDYDAILMDVQMPKMDGYEATKKIRNGTNPVGRDIPIIAMTANAFADDIQHSLDCGMNAHISKPINLKLLE